MEIAKILALSVVAACAYGIAQDQVTARVCIEYFTIGHPRLFASESPTLHALAWGVIATWWFGLILGAMLAAAARAGRKGKLRARELVRPIILLLICIAAVAAVSGLAGYALARMGAVRLIAPMASRVPSDRHVAFLANMWAHTAAYGTGLVGAIVVCIFIVRKRRKNARAVAGRTEAVYE